MISLGAWCVADDWLNGLVTYTAGVVVQLKVSLLLAGLWWFGLGEIGALAKVVVVQLILEGLVRGLREHALLF